MLPHTTVNQAIANIPSNAKHHDLARVKKFHKRAYSGDRPLKRTICRASGQEGYHPSGKRNFTDCEVALLNGFPLQHQFGDKDMRGQVGNAVPPIVAKAYFKEVIKALEATDGVE